MPLKVDIWSDVQCPWCYIGKRKFERGVELFGGDVEVEYHSFELAPDTPVDFVGTPIDYLSERKGVAEDQAQAMLDNVTAIAAEVGLTYDFASVRQTNTRKAHELLHFAKSRGKQSDMKERLMAAYFSQGRHVGDLVELADLAAEIGLNRVEVLASLERGEFADDVESDVQQAAAYGITGVPFFVLGGRYAVAGAQSPEIFAAALAEAAENT